MGAALRRRTGGDSARSPPLGQECGAGGPLAARLRDAAEAAVRCSADRVRFVNDSEARLDEFSRALNQVKRKRFRDERQILEAIDKKGELVHFLLDCVRNHFPSRSRILEIKGHLSEHSPAWSRAFDSHVRGCPTCRTVDLTVAQAPSAPPEPLPWVKLPIPFVLELVALCGAVIPLLVILQRSNCALHWLLFLLGILLMLPLAVVLLLRVLRGRAWLLARFAPGQYVLAKKRHRPLPCAWRPSRWLCWHESEEALADPDAARPARSLHSFGFWMARPAQEATPQSTAEVTAVPAAAPAAGSRGSASGRAAAGSGPPAAAGDERPVQALAVSCRELRLEGAQASLQESGHLAGLSRECQFDGSCLLVWPQGGSSSSHPPQLLAKVGAWRLDWALKVLISLAALGACAAVLAAVLPPGLDFHCVHLPTSTRLPLRAFFLMDGSGSVGNDGWESEKRAAVGITQAFQSVYSGGSGGGSLHVGATEFSSSVSNLVHMTDNVTEASLKIKEMGYDAGGTVYSTALQTCQDEMSNYTKAGKQTFDLCVMITDGACSDDVHSRADVARYLRNTTSLFGVFVGSDTSGSTNLQHISSPGFFASASDYDELKRRAAEIAEHVKKASDDRGGKVVEHPLPWWLPLCILGLLPFLAWWIWLLIPKPRPSRPALVIPLVRNRDPQRLRAAGRNEDRPSAG